MDRQGGRDRERGLSSKIRRRYHECFGHRHGRFAFASIVLMVLLGFVAAPHATPLRESVDASGPGPYDPKDVQQLTLFSKRHEISVPAGEEKAGTVLDRSGDALRRVDEFSQDTRASVSEALRVGQDAIRQAGELRLH